MDRPCTTGRGPSPLIPQKTDGDPSIHALFEDANGKLWIGSGRGGLCVFDGTAFTAFQLADGVPFTNVQFILEDREGAIWVGASGGLWKIVGGAVEPMIVVE